jgi:hypothetical protein
MPHFCRRPDLPVEDLGAIPERPSATHRHLGFACSGRLIGKRVLEREVQA